LFFKDVKVIIQNLVSNIVSLATNNLFLKRVFRFILINMLSIFKTNLTVSVDIKTETYVTVNDSFCPPHCAGQ
jgi:hypothetical protein